MTKMVSDFLEAQTLRNQTRGTGIKVDPLVKTAFSGI